MKRSSLWGWITGKAALKRIIAAGAVIVGLPIVWHSYQNGGIFDPDSYAKNQKVQDNQVIFPEEDEYSQEDGGKGDSDLWEKDHKAEEKLNPEDMPDSSILFETKGKLAEFGSADQMTSDANQPGGIPGSPDGDDGPTILVPGGDGSITVPDGTFGPDGNHNGNGSEGNGGGDDSHPSVDPDPIIPDPDPRPELPPDIYEGLIPVETFPDGGISGDGSNVKITLRLTEDIYETNPIYYGEVLDDWKLFCAVCVYVDVDSGEGMPTIYRIEDYNENFKIGSFPKVAKEDFFVDFYFRPNKGSKWQKETWNYKVKPFKVMFSGWEEGTYSSPAWYPQIGETRNLLNYYPDVLPEEWVDIGSLPIDLPEMFPGWSETPQGEPVPLIYNPVLPGRHVLYPLELVPVPEGMSVSMEMNWNYWMCLQTLNEYTGSREMLEVPDGIGMIDLYGVSVDAIKIPSSVLEVNLDAFGLEVSQSYQVDEENPNYASFEGMLLNKDKTVLYAVPSEKKTVTVPETVTYAEISNNAIEEMHFQSGTPIKLELENLHDASLYVPAEAYFTYLAAWGDRLGSNRLLPDNGADAEFIIQDGAILSRDGKILYGLLDSVGGIYAVPDKVEYIEEGAFAGSASLSTVILPDSVKSLNAQAMTGRQISCIICLGAEPPAIKGDSFDNLDVLQVQVPKGAGESYVDAWTQALGREKAEAIVTEAFNQMESKDGYTYLTQEDGAILLKVPEDLVYFNGNELQDVTIKEIGSNVFSNCGQLLVAELPESVKKIGEGAFEKCREIQGIVCYSTDTVIVGENAFAGCSKLRFLAFNAASATFENEYWPGGGMKYCVPEGASGYNGNHVQSGCASYFLESQNEGRLLYGEDEEGRYLLAATDNITGEVLLLPDTLEIDDEAMSGCGESFTLDSAGMARLRYIGDYAFMDSGVTGDIILPDTLRYLGGYTFYGCTGISSIHIDGPLDWYKNEFHGPELRSCVFSGCTNLETVTFGSECGVKTIGEEAFWNTALKSIDLPEGVTGLLSGAFGCTQLTEIKIPANMENIYYSVFDSCSKLKKVEFSSDIPPSLILYGVGYGYLFGMDLPDDFRIVLSGNAAGKEEAYIEAWKYAMIGYGADDQNELSQDQIREGENIVRRLLGLEAARIEAAPAPVAPDAMPAQEEENESEDAGGEPQIDDVQDKAEDAGTGDENAGTDADADHAEPESGKAENEGEEEL